MTDKSHIYNEKNRRLFMAKGATPDQIEEIFRSAPKPAREGFCFQPAAKSNGCCRHCGRRPDTAHACQSCKGANVSICQNAYGKRLGECHNTKVHKLTRSGQGYCK